MNDAMLTQLEPDHLASSLDCCIPNKFFYGATREAICFRALTVESKLHLLLTAKVTDHPNLTCGEPLSSTPAAMRASAECSNCSPKRNRFQNWRFIHKRCPYQALCSTTHCAVPHIDAFVFFIRPALGRHHSASFHVREGIVRPHFKPAQPCPSSRSRPRWMNFVIIPHAPGLSVLVM